MVAKVGRFAGRGTDVMILKIFLPKKFGEKIDHNIGF
jgi:hypothetical protein